MPILKPNEAVDLTRGGTRRMLRPTLASLVGVVCLAQTAWASDQHADVGRYQVIPDALVPGKGGKLQERAVLLDSVTGQTWLIAPEAQQGRSAAPVWVPIEMELPKRSNTATWSNDDPETATNPIPNTVNRPSISKPLPFQREYDDDP